MSTNTIPDEGQCMALLRKHKTPDHIVMHSQRVWEVGKLLGGELIARDHAIDMDLLRASCLLHDIGKYPCILDGGGYHDVRGEEILEQEGYPRVARIVVQHVILRVSREDPVREEHLVYYSDKRVVHDEIVSLDSRFDYLEHTYGKSPAALRGLARMKDLTIRVERDIFALLDFRPGDVTELLRRDR
ncbi:MAG: HD domain-containing protein [Desulfomonilaceae bacterium]|nr:HD domain-containing protein [Desulfomonilaceae bacterium]